MDWVKGSLVNRIRLGFSDSQVSKMEEAAHLFGLEEGMWMELPTFIRHCVFRKTDAIIHKDRRKKREQREKEKAEEAAS